MDLPVVDLSEENLAEIERMLAAASSNLQYGVSPVPFDEQGSHHAQMLSESPSRDVWVVFIEQNGVTLSTAITGNGPCSEANARLYANAPIIIAGLLAKLKQARSTT